MSFSNQTSKFNHGSDSNAVEVNGFQYLFAKLFLIACDTFNPLFFYQHFAEGKTTEHRSCKFIKKQWFLGKKT